MCALTVRTRPRARLGVGEGYATDVRPADCRELCASGVKMLMFMLTTTDITTSPWTTSTVQTTPAPFKIVPDAACAQNPSLTLAVCC